MDQLPFELELVPQFGSNVEFAENPEPRVPCCLVLDISGSMSGDPIRELNNGLECFRRELLSDPLATKRVEVMIVTFGETVEVVNDFQTAEQFVPPRLTCSGMTPMGRAVDLALTKLDQRKAAYKQNGIAYYRPWIFLITDGEPNDPGWEEIAARAKNGELSKAYAMFCVGVQGANMDNLQKFTTRTPLQLDGLRFRDLFLWLSRSMKSVSSSTPGDQVKLEDPTGPQGWGSV
jgi:uncharacterized protein YegL